MTDQEIFNKVAAHLLRQGKRAVERGKCVYRTSEGLSCAVGCLIAPEAYSEDLEGKTHSIGRSGQPWKRQA